VKTKRIIAGARKQPLLGESMKVGIVLTHFEFVMLSCR
jgi:hypothetical protein